MNNRMSKILRNMLGYAFAAIVAFVSVFSSLSETVYAAEDYTPVEWIYIDQDIAENTGQRFDTGVTVNDADTLKWTIQASDFELNDTTSSSFCGIYGSGDKRSGYFFTNNHGNNLEFYLALGSAHDTTKSITLPASGKCTVTAEFDKPNHTYSFGANGNKVDVTTGWPDSYYSSLDTSNCPLPNGSIKVISAAGEDEYMSLKFYGLKIWKNGNLAADCIPAVDSDGKAGIYDKISGRFIGKGDYEHAPVRSGSGHHHEEAVVELLECEHDFQWQTIEAPNFNSDGLEGEVCTKCGARGLIIPTSSYSWVLGSYGVPMINAASAGDTVVFEFNQWNSFPKWFMERIAAKPDVTWVFKYFYENNNYEVTIKPGTQIPLVFDYYGPEKMADLFDSVVTPRE